MNHLPHLSILHQLYLTEEQPFRKVHRMIDLFESIIKTHTVVILAGYVKHNKLSDKAKGLLSQGLRTPSLGTWQLFSRVLFEELSNDNNSLISNYFSKEFNKLEKALQNEKTNVIAFRNGYAHGATPTDAQCLTDIQKFDPFLKQLMQFEWLRESSLVVREEKVWITTSQESLCLHPILLYRKEDSDASYAFFNDLKNDKIGLLNYTLSKHYKEKELFTEFHKHLPLHEWKKSGNNDFYQRIEELTETFKGRTLERDKILQFVVQKSKGYFSIQGNPGIGKSALIAQILKDLRAHSGLKNIKVIEYFIRRGTQQAQVEYLFNYLIRRTDEVFEDGRDICSEGKMVFDLQNQLFSKWRLWEEQNNGQQLLFLIDGLDEGVESNLVTYLPRENFENILFIYGSRPGGHKSIDDLWGQLPVLNHTKLELSGLGVEDIRALIYEVANKYDLNRESPWVDAVQIRSQGNPLYLKLLCDAIENGSISLNDINALPKEIDEYYNAILLRYAQDTIDGDALLTGLFTFAAAKDYLTFAHLGLINQLGQSSIQRIGSTLKEVLIENPLTEDVLDFQLFHESFREYLVRENHKQVSDATGRIINFCINWKDLSGSWEQRYALEHFAAHLSESKKADHHELLLELIYDQAYVTEQKNILKNFDSSAQLYQLGLLKASELDKFDNTLEAALCLVDLHYEEANDAPQIIEMVANGDIDLALKRIERFGGNDQEGMKRKFTLYMLCLMELTLLGSKDKPFKKSGIQKLLNHLDEQVPRDTSLIDWYNFFPSYIVFLMSCEWLVLNLDFKLVYKWTKNLESDWISEKGPYDQNQYNVLLESANGINNPRNKNNNLMGIANALSKQGIINKALECLNCITEEFHKINILGNIAKEVLIQGNHEEATSLMEKAFKCTESIKDDWEKSIALNYISNCLAQQGKVNEALECSFGISDEYQKSRALIDIATYIYKEGEQEKAKSVIKKAIECQKNISDIEQRCNVQNEISTELFKQGMHEEATSVMNEALKCAQSINDDWLRNIALKDISCGYAKQGKVDESLACTRDINDNEQKSDTLTKISSELTKIGKVDEAVVVINEAIEFAYEIINEEQKSIAFKSIFNELAKHGHIKKAASVMRKALEYNSRFNVNYKQNVSLEISIEFSKLGKLEESFECVLYLINQKQKSCAYKEISTELFKQGMHEEATSVMNEALKCAQSINDDWLRNIALKDISCGYAKQGKVDESLACTRDINDNKQKSDALTKISSELTKIGKVDEAVVVINEAIEFAYEIVDELQKIQALKDISTELNNLGEFDESTLIMDKALEFTNSLNSVRRMSQAFVEISEELVKQGKTETALEFVRQISDDWRKTRGLISISIELNKSGDQNEAYKIIQESLENSRAIGSEINKSNLIKDISIELAKRGNWHLALEIGSEISQIAMRQSCWKEMAESIKKHSDWQNSLKLVDKLQNEEARLFYLKGWSESLSPFETDNSCFKEAVSVLMNDSQSVENLLQAYALNQLMFGRPTKEQVKRLNKTLNLQWAIDIVKKFPKEVEDGRFSHNLEDWIHEIVDEDERDQIELWARQVLKGKISEEDFKNNIENI
ncbi:NACHT domain-containing protein [Aquirufa sp. OSTEICH-129V]|uniref:NACHT domain-containing protein n=1 Tax=Aquirufa avitistagni TaxID=3104728 RepID=A0ABW6D925_9BACT